jgi:hypothetical protein
MATRAGTGDPPLLVGASTDTKKENAVKGMPHLFYAAGAGSPPTWVGRTLVVGENPHDVRRIYQHEDALPLPPDPEPAAHPLRRFALRRIFGATAG